MQGKVPKISIGLPVYNGENFISEALDSILAQTEGDFEIVICDNYSDDRTEEICRRYADSDRRIRYYRNYRNLGAAPNFNKAFRLSKGKYFKWAAHDDLLAREYLSECAKILDKHDSVVLCQSDVKFIDKEGTEVALQNCVLPELASEKAFVRFRNAIQLSHWCLDIFGLIRADTLRKSRLISSYVGGDRILLAELTLWGPFYRIPNLLFFSREHNERSIRSINVRERTKWFDSSKGGFSNGLHFRYLAQYSTAILRVPIVVKDKIGCYAAMAYWSIKYRRQLLEDVKYSVEDLLK